MDQKFDIAIYGAGPATLFFLEKYYNTNIRIAIIDSGSFKEKENLNTIDKVTGPIKFYHGSNKEKSEGFFGTCRYWRETGIGGKLQKFDISDFEENSWPFDYKKINNYYDLAIQIINNRTKLDLKNDFEFNTMPPSLKSFDDDFDLTSASSTLTYNFKNLYRSIKKDFINCKNLSYFSNVKLARFNMDYEKKIIDSAECVDEKKNKIKFFAKEHILSCGCLENNRIILNSFLDKPEYIRKYNIGRYISFHQAIDYGNYKTKKSIKLSDIKKKFNPKNKIIFLKSLKQKNFNSALTFSFSYYRGNNFLLNKTILKYLNFIDQINFSLLIEHKPSFNSQISLSKNKTSNDLYKINIHTEFSKENLHMIEKSKEYYYEKLKKIKILDKYKFNFSKSEINYDTDNHHHGGLLFGKKKEFPVNDDFTLKDFNNLYINGSSLFPSSSIYGPTFTIIACSLMLSDIISKKLAN